MPSKLPRVSFVINGEELEAVKRYQRENHIKSLSKAVISMISMGLEIEQQRIAEEEAAKNNKHSSALSEAEQTHIKKYRFLDEHGKEVVDTVLDIEHRRVELAANKNDMEASASLIDLDKIIPFRISQQPASAGTGVFLGPDEFTTIYITRNELTRHASFAVPVSGDSMEPKYHDGDILLVESAEEVEVGKIGVFTIDGKGYVKERGHGELISLNPEYGPVPMDESIKCNGRVIGILKPEWILDR